MIENQKNKVVIYLILTILLCASVPVVVKLLLQGMNSFQLLFWYAPISFITLFLISIFQGKWKIIKKYKPKDYFNFLYLGLIGIFLYSVLLYTAWEFASAQEVFIINYFWPIAIILFAVPILKEKLTWKKIIGISLAFFGVAIIGSKGLTSLNFNIGWILAFLAALSWGLFSVLGKKYKYEHVTSMAFFYVVGFIFILPFIFFKGGLIFPTLIQWMGLIWLGAFTGGIGYIFWFYALEKGDTAKISTIMYLTPFISMIFIAIFLKEKILLSSIIGLLFIVAGILIQNKKK